MNDAPTAEAQTPVTRWFGTNFATLHPQLQALHRQGGTLSGRIDIHVAQGLAGFVGRRLAASLGIPVDQPQRHLQVQIKHTNGGLDWIRRFDNGAVMASRFVPVGLWPQGYWLETTGPMQLRLTVDVRDGGWHWRVLGLRLRGLPLPLWLFPKSQAGKWIEGGHYVFEVAFSLPLIGTVLGYRGALIAEAATTSSLPHHDTSQ